MTPADRRRTRIYTARLNVRRWWTTDPWRPIYVLAYLWATFLSLVLVALPDVFHYLKVTP